MSAQGPIRDRAEPAAGLAMAAIAPKAEVNPELQRCRHGPLRVDGAPRDVAPSGKIAKAKPKQVNETEGVLALLFWALVERFSLIYDMDRQKL
jgi:hypothetical protein